MSNGRPSVADGLEVNEATDGLTVYDPGADRIHYLNATAAVVFALCDGRHTVEEIARLVASAFGREQPALGEVESCVSKLRSEGILV